MSAKVTREEIEAKVRDIQESIKEATEEARRSGFAVVVAAFFVLLGVAYFLGRRSGRRRAVVVELRRG